MVETVTLTDIAGKHPKTEDEIFDHAKNTRIKTLRTTKDKLETGDTVVVSKDMDPDCWLVVGHDL